MLELQSSNLHSSGLDFLWFQCKSFVRANMDGAQLVRSACVGDVVCEKISRLVEHPNEEIPAYRGNRSYTKVD